MGKGHNEVAVVGSRGNGRQSALKTAPEVVVAGDRSHGLTATPDVAVVGAGVVGCAVAWALTKAGKCVLLIDRADPATAGASFGNVGHIATEQLQPLPSRSQRLRRKRSRLQTQPTSRLCRLSLCCTFSIFVTRSIFYAGRQHRFR